MLGDSNFIGASGGEGLSVGADYIMGNGYSGGQLNVGAGGGLPLEGHIGHSNSSSIFDPSGAPNSLGGGQPGL